QYSDDIAARLLLVSRPPHSVLLCLFLPCQHPGHSPGAKCQDVLLPRFPQCPLPPRLLQALPARQQSEVGMDIVLRCECCRTPDPHVVLFSSRGAAGGAGAVVPQAHAKAICPGATGLRPALSMPLVAVPP